MVVVILYCINYTKTEKEDRICSRLTGRGRPSNIARFNIQLLFDYWDITPTPQQNIIPLLYFDWFIRGILNTLTGGRLEQNGGGGGADGTFVQTSFCYR